MISCEAMSTHTGNRNLLMQNFERLLTDDATEYVTEWLQAEVRQT